MYGITTWSSQYTSVTYVAVTESTHGISSPYIGVVCIDNNGNRVTLDQVDWTVDPNTYEVDITFNNTFTGTVRLSGPWPASDTSNSTDFEVTIGVASTAYLNMCLQCGTYTARRTYNGNTYVAVIGGYLEWISFTSNTIYVYLSGNMPTYGLADNPCAGTYNASSNVKVQCGVTAMPSGVVPLASATISNGAFTSVTDLRPW